MLSNDHINVIYIVNIWRLALTSLIEQDIVLRGCKWALGVKGRMKQEYW